MARILLALLVSATDDGWLRVEHRDGILVEARPVKGSGFAELRLSTTSAKTVGALCDEAWGDGQFDSTEPDLTLRTLVSESPTERVVYEQIAPAIVSARDYALRFTLLRDAERCTVVYVIANDLAPPTPAGFVRISRMWGTYTFAPTEGGTRVTWVTYADPAGALPPFLVEGGRRSESVSRFKLLLARAMPRSPAAK